MDVRNCRMCGAIYNYIGGSYRNLCPACIQVMEDKFDEVKKYIEEHPGASISQVSTECDVRTEQIERWVREERLLFAEDSPIGIPCESCGTMIKTGRYCDKCRMELGNGFANAYSQPKVQPQRVARDTSAKMRFFDD